MRIPRPASAECSLHDKRKANFFTNRAGGFEACDWQIRAWNYRHASFLRQAPCRRFIPQ